MVKAVGSISEIEERASWGGSVSADWGEMGVAGFGRGGRRRLRRLNGVTLGSCSYVAFGICDRSELAWQGHDGEAAG